MELGDQAGALRQPGLDLGARLFKPVGDQIGPARHPTGVAMAQPVHIVVAQLAAHHFVAQEGRIADDDIRLGPSRLAAVRVEQGVAVLDAVERPEDRFTGDVPAIAATPLDIADPHRGARQFGGELVDFDAADVLRPGEHGQGGRIAQLLGIDVELFLHVAQRLERQVKEIARAAGRIEHAEGNEPLDEPVIAGAALLKRLATCPFALTGGDGRLNGVPFGKQGLSDQRADEFADGTGVSVMGTEGSTGGWVQTALEEGAKNGWVDGPPVAVAGGTVEGGEIIGGERRDVDGPEQAAVEPGDVVVAIFAAGLLLHRGKEPGNTLGGLAGIHSGVFQEIGEDVAGQQFFILGKHTEQALDKKMGNTLAVEPAPAHILREVGKLAGRLLGNRRGRLFRTEFVRIGEHPAEHLPDTGVGQFLDEDLPGFVGIAGEGRVDDDAFTVAHHQKRRVVELQGIVGELLERSL